MGTQLGIDGGRNGRGGQGEKGWRIQVGMEWE